MPNPIGPKILPNLLLGLTQDNPQEAPKETTLTPIQQAVSDEILRASQGNEPSAAAPQQAPDDPSQVDPAILAARQQILQSLQNGRLNSTAAPTQDPTPAATNPPDAKNSQDPSKEPKKATAEPTKNPPQEAPKQEPASDPSLSSSALLNNVVNEMNSSNPSAGAINPPADEDADAKAARELMEKNNQLLGDAGKDQTQFSKDAQAANEKSQQEKKDPHEDPLTDKRTWYGGAVRAEENNIWSYTNDQLERNYLWHSDDPLNASKQRWGINAFGTLFIQNGFNIPGVKNKPTDEMHQLFAPGGGPLINAATGEPIQVASLVPERTFLSRLNLVGGIEAYYGSQYDIPWLRDNVPFLGTFLANLAQPTVRAQLELIGRYDAIGNSSNGPYKIVHTGAIVNPDGTVSSTGDIDPQFGKFGLDYHFYGRAVFPSTIIRIPGLTYGYEKLTGVDLYEKKENAGVLDETFKFIGEALFAPKIAPYVVFERRPDVDEDHDTLLDPPRINYKGGLLWMNTGLGIEWGKEKDTTKLGWKDVDTQRIFWAMPLKIPFKMLGWDKVLADSFEVDGFEPLANPDTLMFDSSKFVLYTETKDYRGSSNPLLGEAFDGSGGPGGPGGKNVTGHSTGFGGALEVRFQETPFDTGILNTIFGNSKWTVGTQIMDLKIKGNDLPLDIPLSGNGSVGSITTEAPASLLPNASGKWWSASIDYEKMISLGGHTNLRLGLYLDQRKILGDVTDNSVSDKPITTFGIQVGLSGGMGFSKGATDI